MNEFGFQEIFVLQVKYIKVKRGPLRVWKPNGGAGVSEADVMKKAKPPGEPPKPPGGPPPAFMRPRVQDVSALSRDAVPKFDEVF